MDQPSEISEKRYGEYGQPIEPTFGQKLKRFLGPIGVVVVAIAKFFAKLKFIIIPVLKFFPLVLKTGGTMLLSIWIYALAWGWWFAIGFVLLIFVHECGHLIVARQFRLKVGAPMFIPFFGAFITLKENPSNAWVESWVGIGGPILGTVGSMVCYLIFLGTGSPMYCGLAHVGFLINLFNLAPVGQLDGGRIVTALSPWLWIIGFGILVVLLVAELSAGHLSPILIFILILSVPRLVFLFREKSDAQRRYFEVAPVQRAIMSAMYFGLIAILVIGMRATYIAPNVLERQ